MPTQKELILKKFKIFTGNTGGIDSWLGPHTNDVIINRLASIENDPLTLEPCLSGYHPHPLYVVCLLGLQARAGAGALRRRSG